MSKHIQDQFAYKTAAAVNSRLKQAKEDIKSDIEANLPDLISQELRSNPDLLAAASRSWEYGVITQSSVEPNVTGTGLLSSPDTLLHIITNGVAETKHFKPFFSNISAIGPCGDEVYYFCGGAYSFFGYDGRIVNLNSDPANIKFKTQWELIDNKPTGIYHFNWINRSEEVEVKAFSFAYAEVVYVVMDIFGAPGMRYSTMFIKGPELAPTTRHHQINGKDIISVQFVSPPDSSRNFIMGCTGSGTSQWYIGGHRNPDVAFDNALETYTGAHTGLGVGNILSGATNTRVVFAFSLQTGTPAEGAAVLENALTNWESAYQACVDYWTTFWSQFTADWAKVPEAIRFKGYLAVQQLVMTAWNGALSAGPASWGEVWIRDACWPLRSLAKCHPPFAKTLATWWATATVITDKNSYELTGNSLPNMNNTDNAAVMLMALAELYETTNDLTLMESLRYQLNACIDWAEEWYVPADKHIRANHPHDYWDEPGYVYNDGEVNGYDIIYESFIDVIWIYAMEKAAPLFTALGEAIHADFCTTTATQLRLGLEDYRDPYGGFYYAINPDKTVKTDVVASPGNIYAALLLNDEGCRKWLFKPEITRYLGVRYWPVQAAVNFSNFGYDALEAASRVNKDHAWGPHIPIVAAEAYKLGDKSHLPWIARSLPSGCWPEDLQIGEIDPDKWINCAPTDLAVNFTWSLSAVIDMCNEIAKFEGSM